MFSEYDGKMDYREIYRFYVEFIKKGYVLSGLQTILVVFEKNENLYKQKTYFSIFDVNKDKFDKQKRFIPNLYEKLGFNVLKHDKQSRINNKAENIKKEKNTKSGKGMKHLRLEMTFLAQEN